MIRNLKALGLAAFAVMALGAMFASGAQAQEGFFTAGHTENELGEVEHTDATVLGEQYGEVGGTANNVFLAGEGQVNCHNATFTGTLEDGGTSHAKGVSGTSLTVEPHYEECFAEGISPATVKMNGCDYLFTQPETWGHDPSFTGKADLDCSTSEVGAITITVYLFGNSTEGTHSFPVCTIEVFPEEGTEQELGGHIIYTPGTSNEKDDITANATVEGISFNDECHEESGNGATYSNTVTIKAFEDEGEEKQIDAWISE